MVIPTYNRADQISAAVDSVRAQTYSNWELLVVDDASEDSTAAVIAAIEDARIRFVTLPENKGAAGARNKGVELASGLYIAFLDSDDVWRENKLEKHLAFVLANAEKRRISCTAFTIREPADSFIDHREFFHEISHREMLHGCFISPGSTMLAKRDTFTQIGLFDDRLRRLEDWDWLLRATRRHSVFMLNDALTDVHAGGAIDPKSVAQAIDIMKQKRRDYEFKSHSKEEAIFLSTLSHELAACHYRNGHHVRAIFSMLHSMILMPVKSKGFYRRMWRRMRPLRKA